MADGGTMAGAGSDAAGFAGAAGAPESGCELVYEAGHADLFIHDEGGLRVSIRAAFAGAQETIEPAPRVCVVVPRASYALAQSLGGVPDQPEFAFLGLPPSSAFWLLPATPRAGIPWLGASTESLLAGHYADEEVVLSLTLVERPAEAEVAVWSTSSLGSPLVLFASSSMTWQHAFPVGAHLHFNWSFTRPGDYAVDLQASAALLGNGGETGVGGAGGVQEAARETSPAARLRFLVKP